MRQVLDAVEGRDERDGNEAFSVHLVTVGREREGESVIVLDRKGSKAIDRTYFAPQKHVLAKVLDAPIVFDLTQQPVACRIKTVGIQGHDRHPTSSYVCSDFIAVLRRRGQRRISKVVAVRLLHR